MLKHIQQTLCKEKTFHSFNTKQTTFSKCADHKSKPRSATSTASRWTTSKSQFETTDVRWSRSCREKFHLRPGSTSTSSGTISKSSTAASTTGSRPTRRSRPPSDSCPTTQPTSSTRIAKRPKMTSTRSSSGRFAQLTRLTLTASRRTSRPAATTTMKSSTPETKIGTASRPTRPTRLTCLTRPTRLTCLTHLTRLPSRSRAVPRPSDLRKRCCRLSRKLGAIFCLSKLHFPCWFFEIQIYPYRWLWLLRQ